MGKGYHFWGHLEIPLNLAGLVARSSSFAEAAPRGFVARDPRNLRDRGLEL